MMSAEYSIHLLHDGGRMKEKMLDKLDIFIFAKDKNFRYLYCSENMAAAAGLDSPIQIIGKTDYDLCWKKHVELYRRGDIDVLNGGTRINVPEPQPQINKLATILTTKNILKDKHGYSRGIIGSYLDITGYTLKKNNGNFDKNKYRFYIEENSKSEYFTKQELQIFKCIILGWDVDKIASKIFRSKKTVESHIAKIKLKLQCSSKNQIAPRAIELGLTYIIDNPKLEGDAF